MTLIKSPVFELLASMFRLHNHERLEDGRRNPDEASKSRLDAWVQGTRVKIYGAIEQELELFFNRESFFGLTLVRWVYANECHGSLDEFRRMVADADAPALLVPFLQTGFAPDKLPDTGNPQEVAAYIRTINLPEPEKWKLAYLLADPEETKRRLLVLFDRCREGYFEADRPIWEESQTRAAELAGQQWLTRGRDMLGDLLVHTGLTVPEDSGKRIVLAPSHFYYRSSLVSDTDGVFIYLFGSEVLRLTEHHSVEDAVEIFRILGDEKRMKIIQILNAGPQYGYELAQKLELSNSTVSHHLSALSSVGLLESMRVENKVFYRLRKEELEQLLARITKTILQ